MGFSEPVWSFQVVKQGSHAEWMANLNNGDLHLDHGDLGELQCFGLVRSALCDREHYVALLLCCMPACTQQEVLCQDCSVGQVGPSGWLEGYKKHRRTGLIDKAWHGTPRLQDHPPVQGIKAASRWATHFCVQRTCACTLLIVLLKWLYSIAAVTVYNISEVKLLCKESNGLCMCHTANTRVWSVHLRFIQQYLLCQKLGYVTRQAIWEEGFWFRVTAKSHGLMVFSWESRNAF